MKSVGNIAPVNKTVLVPLPIEAAFELFTAGVDRWWPKTASTGATPIVESLFEPRSGGRWYSRHEDASEQVRGHVRIWEPFGRVVVTWELNAAFKPDPREELASDVEVRFVADTANRTRVDLEHRNFERMGAEAGQAVRDRVETGWSRMLELFVKAAGG